MTLKVEHRTDQLLQKTTQEPLEPNLKKTYIEKVTRPHHEMVLKFLEKVIINQKFKDEAALEKALATWPKFAASNGLKVHPDWNSINLYSNEAVIAFAGGPGSLFVVGLIKELTS